MDAAHLRVFEAVRRLGGMNRAPAELHTVQSNVTARVRLLGEELGAPLFRRHSRAVVLTVAGPRLPTCGGCAAPSKVVRFAAESLARCGVRGSTTRPGAIPARSPGFCSGYPE